jgi:hypothetical protein
VPAVEHSGGPAQDSSQVEPVRAKSSQTLAQIEHKSSTNRAKSSQTAAQIEHKSSTNRAKSSQIEPNRAKSSQIEPNRAKSSHARCTQRSLRTVHDPMRPGPHTARHARTSQQDRTSHVLVGAHVRHWGGAYRRTTRLMDATEDAPARQRTMRVCATQSPIVGHGDRPALFSFYMNMVEPPGRTMPHDPCSCSEITQCATLMVCGDRNSHFPAHMMEPPDRCMHMTMSVHSNTSSAIMSRQQHMRIVA